MGTRTALGSCLLQLTSHQLPLLQAAAGLPALAAASQQQHHALTLHATQRRRYAAADAPEPLIVPAQRRQPAPLPPQQLQEVQVALPPANQGPWQQVVDKRTGQPYWWCEATGVTTPVGASRPDAWVAVVDKQSGAQYYWNKQSGETTAVGEPLPGPEGRLASAGPAGLQQGEGRPGMVSLLANSLAVGFGVGLVFAVIRMVF